MKLPLSISRDTAEGPFPSFPNAFCSLLTDPTGEEHRLAHMRYIWAQNFSMATVN